MRKLAMMAAALTFGVAVVAQSATPADVIKSRQQHLKDIGKAMKGTADSFKSGTPDAALIRANANVIGGYADQLGTWFPAGTAMGGPVKTSAKPEIWTDRAGFTKAAADFSAAAKNFRATAQGNDLAATGKALQALGGTCKSCHEKFRAKDD
jgi:cytochrome c556